jgi:hypothetical protein
MDKKVEFVDSDIQQIIQEKQSAFKFKERRLTDWDDTYTLYRDRPITNRLIQRQSVNVPLMKYAINTIMKDIDGTPQIYFRNLGNDEQAEIFFNEMWKEFTDRNNIETAAEIDRKQALLFGRSFKKINVQSGKVTMEVIDPRDMLIDRFVDPARFHNARILIQTGIFKPLAEIINNPEYDEGAKEKLQTYYASQTTTLAQDSTYEWNTDRDRRLSQLGVQDAYSPTMGATYIELNEVYRYEWCDKHQKELIFVYIVAVADSTYYKLYKGRLYELLGETDDNCWHNHFPYTSWGNDVERTDFWSDGAGDILRTPNKIANSWLSQLVENRQLRNFGMTFYDSTNPNFVPQTYTPVPWGFYPVAGNPREVLMPVDIPDLSESLDEIQYVIGLAEKATAATSTQTGTVEKSTVTLGEVQLALANAQDRVKSVQKFIDADWKEFGYLFTKILEGMGDAIEPVITTKRGRLGIKTYRREVAPKDYKSKKGYAVEVLTIEDKQQKDVDTIQKLQAAVGVMPNNMILQDIYKKRLLDFAGLEPEEVSAILEEEKMPQAPQAAPLEEAQGMMGAEAQDMEMPQLSPAMSSQAQGQADMQMPDLMGGTR